MARNYRKEYDNYHSRPENKIRNAARLRARRALVKAGKVEVFDGKDVHHKDNNPLNNDPKNLSVVTQHYNRKEPRLRERKLKSIIDKALKSEASSFAQAAAIAISKQKSGDYHKSGKKKGLRKTKHKNPDHPKAKTNKQRKKEKQWEDAVSRAKERAALKKKHDREKEAERTAVKRASMGEGIDSDAMIDLMQKYLNTKNKNEKKVLLKQINKYQKKLGLKVTEDMGTVTGPAIAGTGDDSDTVVVRKKQKVMRRKRLLKSIKRWSKEARNRK